MKKTSTFLIITFIISFAAAGIYYINGGTGTGSLSFTLLGTFYMFIPTMAVLFTKKIISKEPIVKDLMVSFKLNHWFWVAWLTMPVIMFASIAVSTAMPNTVYNPEMTGFIKRLSTILTLEQTQQMTHMMKNMPISPIWITLVQGLFAGITINAVAAFGEELGWRGFLLHQFKEMKFIKASVIIGLIWGIWHAPLILMGHNYPQHPQIGVFMMIVLCLLLTPFMMYITIKAKSVIAAAIMHGTMNAVASISIMAIDGGNDLTTGIVGVAGFITLSIFLLALYIFDTHISKEKVLSNTMDKFI